MLSHYYAQAYGDFQDHGWTGPGAEAAALGVGVWSTGVESATEYLGKIPGVSHALAKFGVQPGSKWASRYFLSVLGKAPIEIGEEALQDLAAPAMQAILSSFDAVPARSQSFKEEWDSWKREQLGPTALIALPLAALCSGVTTSAEIGRAKVDAMTLDQEALASVFGEAKAAEIVGVKDGAQREGLMRKAWGEQSAAERLTMLKASTGATGAQSSADPGTNTGTAPAAPRGAAGLTGADMAQREAAVKVLEESGALLGISKQSTSYRVHLADGTLLRYSSLKDAQEGRARYLERQQQKLHEETREALNEPEVAPGDDAASDVGSEPTAAAPPVAGAGTSAGAKVGAQAKAAVPTEESGSAAATEQSREAAATSSTAEDGNTQADAEAQAQGEAAQQDQTVASETRTTSDPEVLEATHEHSNQADVDETAHGSTAHEAAYRQADAHAVLGSADSATRAATRSVLGTNAAGFQARVQEVADMLGPTASRRTRLGEAMAQQSGQMITAGHKELLVEGLREVERQMATRGNARQFLPAKDNADLTDQEVTDAFAAYAKSYLTGKELKTGGTQEERSNGSENKEGRKTSYYEATQDTRLAPLMNAVTRVVNAAVRRSDTTSEPVYAMAQGSNAQEQNGRARPSAEERHAENHAILASNPVRRAPISKAFAAKGDSIWAHVMRKATLLADRVHDDGDTPHADFTTIVEDPDSDAQYFPIKEGRNEMAQLGIRPEARFPLQAALHEMGHHIAQQVLGKAAVRAVAEVALSSGTCRKIKKYGVDLDYWLGYEELFCRVYSQFVLAKSGEMEALEEMKLRRTEPDSFFWLWTDQEFSRISRELAVQLKEKHWL